jgi:hypothetical protein
VHYPIVKYYAGHLQSLYDLRIAQQEAGKIIQALPTLKRMSAVHA